MPVKEATSRWYSAKIIVIVLNPIVWIVENEVSQGILLVYLLPTGFSDQGILLPSTVRQVDPPDKVSV
jgi:hypothetical protein